MDEYCLAPIRYCPECRGIKTDGHLKCRTCEGRGWVPLDICLACGRPAFEQGGVVPYCGREECFKRLVHVVDTKTPVRVVPIVSGRRVGYVAGYGSMHGCSNPVVEAALRKAYQQDGDDPPEWPMC